MNDKEVEHLREYVTRGCGMAEHVSGGSITYYALFYDHGNVAMLAGSTTTSRISGSGTSSRRCR